VLSDGGDNASRQSLDDVLLNARQSNATIYAIDMYRLHHQGPDR
jgi:hypothetical protein